MGNTNSMVSVMFEEIKSLIKSLEKKLDEKAVVKEIPPASETTKESKPESKSDTIKPEQLIRVIASHLQGMEQKTGQISESVRESEKHFLFHMEELKQVIINADKDRLVRHHHVIDLGSSKVVVSIVSLSVLLLASLIGNVQQFEVNSRMTDNDLKYRYIQSNKGINQQGLNKLEDIFYYQRDKKRISEIRGKVGTYEKKVREAAEKLEKQTTN